MSHGGGGDSGVVEPPLTPLLDLVLQLLMFFIACVNFATQQVSGDIKLPYSDTAKPIEKADLDTLYLNQKSMRSKDFRDKLTPEMLQRFENQESVVLIPGTTPKTVLEAKSWLREHYEDTVKKAGGDESKVKTVIHFRPDGEIEMNEFFRLMKVVQASGYTRLKVRAIVGRGRGGA